MRRGIIGGTLNWFSGAAMLKRSRTARISQALVGVDAPRSRARDPVSVTIFLSSEFGTF
jgi:hypothetical protein